MAFGERYSGMSCNLADSLEYTLLDWTDLDWSGLTWNDLDWSGLDWTDLDWSGPFLTDLDVSGLIWNELNWSGLIWNELNWTVRHTYLRLFTSSQVPFTATRMLILWHCTLRSRAEKLRFKQLKDKQLVHSRILTLMRPSWDLQMRPHESESLGHESESLGQQHCLPT